MKILNEIQQKLKVPKQVNKSVSYKSRSAEDIIEMVKPLLGEAILTISDELIMVGERYYIKATATITNTESEHEKFCDISSYRRGEKAIGKPKPPCSCGADEKSVESVSATAYAREDETPKFMSVAQGTGSTSSYARKYALNGLLLIDDTQDDDTRPHVEPKKLTLPEQISEAISQATNIKELETIADKTRKSVKLTDNEKDVLMAEIDFKSEDLSNELTK